MPKSYNDFPKDLKLTMFSFLKSEELVNSVSWSQSFAQACKFRKSWKQRLQGVTTFYQKSNKHPKQIYKLSL